MNIKRSSFGAQNIAFSGHNKKTNTRGYDVHSFYYLYDPKKYSCEVELYNINKDKNGNLSVGKPVKTIDMPNAHAEIDTRRLPELTSKEGFAYRFKLTELDANGKKAENAKVSYAFDNGTVIGIFDNTDKYNVVLNNRATINKNGAMQLIMPDGYYPGVVKGGDGKPYVDTALRATALTSVRTHANKLGGNFHGIIKRLDEIANKEGVTRIVGTPVTDDTISSHLYWTENAYRVCPGLGSEEDFKQLQVELFKRGINWIADAALVNEGFGGIHISELLRKGQNSVAKDMFRADEVISLGILPDKCDYTRMKMINAPFTLTSDGAYSAKNPKYDAKKPTYIQFYDSRLASKEQIESEKPMDMTTYANKNTDNIYDITRHDDAVYPFPIEVDPEQLKRNVKTLYEQQGNIDLVDVDTIKAISSFQNFNVQNKSAASGLEVWDGNVDIAKLNFYMSLNDDLRFNDLPADKRQDAIDDFKRGALAVRDYAINSGRHWTKLASDAQLQYMADLFSSKCSTKEEYMAAVKDAVRKGDLPAIALKIEPAEYESVLKGTHKSRRLHIADIRSEFNKEDYRNTYKYQDYILKQAMDVPLETIPVATNLLGVLTSPYIAKKANIESELAVSRYDLYKAANPNLPEKYSAVYTKMDDIYQDDLLPIMEEILSGLKDTQNEKGNVSNLGKFEIAEVVPDLTRYLLLKALAPDAKVEIKNGNFDFSKVDEAAITIQSLGIPYSGKTMEQEADIVVKAIKNGLSDIPKSEIDKLKVAVETRLKNRSEVGYKMAEMVMDKTEAGLGWRIDAAKDIASIDSVRSGVDSMEQAFNNVTDFWAKYNQTVLVENPRAYTTAEMTDLDGLFGAEAPSKYISAADAERKFLEATGITSIANYNYFFSLLPDLFAPLYLEDFDDANGWQAQQEKNFKLLAKMNQGWGNNPGFLFNSPDDGVKNAYNFVGNHDKSRILHLLALDAEVMRSKSIADAMGDRLKTAFSSVLKDKDEIAAVKEAISQMVSGTFKGKSFDATAFGTRPFDVAISTVLEQVEYNGKTIADVDKVKNQTLQSILEPAFDRYLGIYKTLVTLPGSPTDFAGDRVGNSGHETKAKNYHQQNRNVIHWEWLDENSELYLPFVKTFYNSANQIANLRKVPELSALNNGDTITLNVLQAGTKPEDAKTSEKVQAILRYNDEGSKVLSFYNTAGASTKFDQRMNKSKGENVISDAKGKIYLFSDSGNPRSGLKHGLEVGMEFYNAANIGINNKYEKYVVEKDLDGNYYLQKYSATGSKPCGNGLKPDWKIDKSAVEITDADNNVLVLYQPKK